MNPQSPICQQALLNLYYTFKSCPREMLGPVKTEFYGIHFPKPILLRVIPPYTPMLDPSIPIYVQNFLNQEHRDRDIAGIDLNVKQENSQIIEKCEEEVITFCPLASTQLSLNHHQNSNLFMQLKSELETMIGFLVFNIQNVDQKRIINGRIYYSQNPLLLRVYDILVIKYSKTRKNKEDLIRYVLRKAIKTIRNWIMKNSRVSRKKASVLFCEKYLQVDAAYLRELGIDVKSEEEIIEFALPYKKKSKNKTMNMSFVLEIFQTKAFLDAYQHFLPELDHIIQQDTLKRKEKLVSILLDCAKTNNFTKIESFSRLPWLDVWIRDLKTVAIGIMPRRLVYTNTLKQQKNS